VLDGELAVPCNPKAAYAGLNSLSRIAAHPGEAVPGGGLDPTQQTLVNPVRSGRKQR